MIETKVKASTGAAALSGLLLWILGRYVFKGTVPDVVTSWVYAIVPGIIAGVAGYLAPHTPRPPAAPPRPEKTLIPPAEPPEGPAA